MSVLICCRALLSPDSCLLDKYCGKRTNHYDVPCATSVSDDWVFMCCGLFELVKWNVCHHSCVDVIWPFRQQLLESETAFCDICHKNCISIVDYIFHHECMHLCLPLFVCPVCCLSYLTRSCLQMHVTEFHGGLSSAQQFLSFSRNPKN